MVCSHLLAEVTGLNTAGSMDVCLLWVLCVVTYRSLRWADHSSRGVLPTVVYQSDHEASIMRRPWPTRGYCAMGKKKWNKITKGPQSGLLLSIAGLNPNHPKHHTTVFSLSLSPANVKYWTYTYIKKKKKGKVITLQARCGPESG